MQGELHRRVVLSVLTVAFSFSVMGCTAAPDNSVARVDRAASDARAAASETPATGRSEPMSPEAEPPAAEPVKGLDVATVVRVVDGDTAVLSVGGKQERVRFIGVDTPESTTEHEPYGEEAARYTRSVLKPGRKVYLEYDAELRDRYERLLAYVWLQRPAERSDAELRAKQFDAKLLLEGYAQQLTIQPNSRYADLPRRRAQALRRLLRRAPGPTLDRDGRTSSTIRTVSGPRRSQPRTSGCSERVPRQSRLATCPARCVAPRLTPCLLLSPLGKYMCIPHSTEEAGNASAPPVRHRAALGHPLRRPALRRRARTRMRRRRERR
jgi:endonuclease YncB( thermonuclease family)